MWKFLNITTRMWQFPKSSAMGWLNKEMDIAWPFGCYEITNYFAPCPNHTYYVSSPTLCTSSCNLFFVMSTF